MPWPEIAGTKVTESAGKGRGLFAARKFLPGQPILCEAALASAALKDEATATAWHNAAQLVRVILEKQLLSRTVDLAPNAAPEAADADEVTAVDSLLPLYPGASREELRRVMHVVRSNSFAFDGVQALFVRCSMVNHACVPNATHQQFLRASDGALCACIRCVAPILAGEEICISYAEDLCAPPSERAPWLRHHGFAPERRPCDDGLEAWLVEANSERRKQAEPVIAAHNIAADKAWLAAKAAAAKAAAARAAAARAAGPASSDDVVAAASVAEERTHLMTAAAHYAKLSQAADGVLGSSHALLLQARLRLAHVMTLSRAQRSCTNALPLWRAALEVTRRCCPPNWPHLITPLRGARDAATHAGDAAAANLFGDELERMLVLLNPKCSDVVDGTEEDETLEVQ